MEVCSAAPARMFGLAGRKGVVAAGGDADLVVYDPTAEHTISAVDPPHGRRLLGLRGAARCAAGRDVVLSRGRVVVDNGEFTGERGWGRFLRRDRADYARLA